MVLVAFRREKYVPKAVLPAEMEAAEEMSFSAWMKV